MCVKEKNEKPVDSEALCRLQRSVWAQDKTDPLGSWTGVPADGEEKPVQDADDL